MFSAALVLSAIAAAPSLRAMPAARAPEIDGRLDDAAWSLAPPAATFTQKFPGEGQAPSERTTVCVLFDQRGLYFAIDEQVGDTGDLFLDWDENWEAATQTSTRGWTAELAIPLRALRFDDTDAPSRGFEVRRYVSSTQEIDAWTYIPRDVAGEMQHYGRLDFGRRLEPAGSIELRPFVLAQLNRRDESAELIENGTHPRGSAGLDARWHPTQDMTLDFTLNPDFGQVEADQVILNLSNTELVFPEKRPFFLEGQEAFSTPMLLLYTRRIGRPPEAPELGDGERQIAATLPSSILGAAKLVGRPWNGVTIASLSALTDSQYSGVRLAGGGEESRLADPTTFFQALRLKSDLGSHASLGLAATAVKRFEPSAAAGTATSTAAADLRRRSEGGDYVARAQAAASLVERGPDRLLADGSVSAPVISRRLFWAASRRRAATGSSISSTKATRGSSTSTTPDIWRARTITTRS